MTEEPAKPLDSKADRPKESWQAPQLKATPAMGAELNPGIGAEGTGHS